MSHPHKLVALDDRTAVGEARRAAMMAAEALGFTEEQRSDVGIVATEAATNIVLYAKAGQLLVGSGETVNGVWLDLLALDAGPGIADLPAAMQDGFSSGGTAGEGLGAILRQSDESGVYSTPGRGTVIWSRFHRGTGRPAGAAWGAVNVPLQGETECGDALFVSPGIRRTVYMMVDGLGHGPKAAEAAKEAVESTLRHVGLPAQEILKRAHDALRRTRGAAMSVAIAHHELRTLTYVGVGNIAAFIQQGGQARSLLSQNGTLGAVFPRQLQEYQYPYEPGSLLVMFSDGLNSKTNLAGYTGLASRHPQLLAGALFRDFARGRDDATVMVARLEAGPTRE